MENKLMTMTDQVIHPDALRDSLIDAAAGAYVSFEGWIRNINEGHKGLRLEYEAYEPIALSEGQRVLEEAISKFDVLQARCAHRTGMLEIG